MSDRMENIALRWLAYEKNCMAVLHERTPRGIAGQPDVMGVTKSRYLIEIEIKRSLSDFRANAKKAHIRNREFYVERFPRQFYFFVPESMADKCELLLPEWAGLAALCDGVRFEVKKTAPVNEDSKKLTIKECGHLLRNMTNQIVSFSNAVENWKQRFIEGPLNNPPYEQRFINESIWSYSI